MASACSRSGPATDIRLLSRNRLPQHLPASSVRRSPHCRFTISILDGELTWGRAEPGYHVFDIVRLDGEDLTRLPFEERQARLAALPLAPPLLRVPPLTDDKPWERACAEGWEGVIAKRRGTPYEHRRSPHWLKMKCENAQELVVGGFTDPKGARVGLGALLVGYYDRRRLRVRG